MMHFFKRLGAGVCLGVFASVAFAQDEGPTEVPLGLWQTEPDMIGVVLHVRTRACGRSLCARVERAKNRQNIDAPSNAVGQKVLWDLKPQPDGGFYGEYRDPAANRYVKSRVEAVGKKLRLKACNDEGCEDLVWVRVK